MVDLDCNFATQLTDHELMIQSTRCKSILEARINLKQFIRILSDVISVEAISAVIFESETSVVIKLKNYPDDQDFYYKDDYANIVAAELIPEVVIRVGNDVVFVRDIEWANLQATFNGQTGVELSVITDPKVNGVKQTRQLTGSLAGSVYDQLNTLMPSNSTETDLLAGAN